MNVVVSAFNILVSSFNIFVDLFQMNKPVNKQDEAWMKPFINQFNNMNFPVSSVVGFRCCRYLSLKSVSWNCSAAVLFSYRFIYDFKVTFKKILINRKFVYTNTNLNDCVMCVPVCKWPFFLSLQRDSPDDSMKVGISDKRVDMGSMGDFNGVMGKNPGSRHQLHKDSAMDRSPYYDKVHKNVCRWQLMLWPPVPRSGCWNTLRVPFPSYSCSVKSLYCGFNRTSWSFLNQRSNYTCAQKSPVVVRVVCRCAQVVYFSAVLYKVCWLCCFLCFCYLDSYSLPFLPSSPLFTPYFTCPPRFIFSHIPFFFLQLIFVQN